MLCKHVVHHGEHAGRQGSSPGVQVAPNGLVNGRDALQQLGFGSYKGYVCCTRLLMQIADHAIMFSQASMVQDETCDRVSPCALEP